MAISAGALDDAERAFLLQMYLHVAKFKDDFAYAVRVLVELLVRAADDDLVEQLPHQLVSFLETVAPALRTVMVNSRLALPAEGLVAREAILRLSH